MLFRFLLFTILAYIIFRWLDGFFRPKKSPEKNTRYKKSSDRNGFEKKGTKSVVKDDVGDYVDFEEIEEKKKN